MYKSGWDPLGRAVSDYFNGDKISKIKVHCDISETEIWPVEMFFRTPDKFSEQESTAIEYCRGNVLDVGACAGCHSLALQEKGFNVCALDISPDAVQVMKARGIKDARCADIFEFDSAPFDTILMMMNGIGVAGDLVGLNQLLERAHLLVEDGGQIIIDSCDLRADPEYDINDNQVLYDRKRLYFGEVEYRFEYKGKTGDAFPWLFIDPDTLKFNARRAGWQLQIVYEDTEVQYLARLYKK